MPTWTFSNAFADIDPNANLDADAASGDGYLKFETATNTFGAARSASSTPHFWFGRPLALDAPGPAPNPVYLYGTTELGQ